MEIPAPVEEVHKPHPLLDETTGQQTVVGEARAARFCTVGLEHLLRLSGDVHHLRHAGLHPEGQFILRDPCDGFGITELLGLQFVQVPEGIQAGTPQSPVHARRIRDIEHRVALRTALHALVDARQKPRAKAARATVGLHARRDHHHEPWQVGILAAEAVGRPTAEARPACPRAPCIDHQLRRRVVELVGEHALHEAELVGHAVQVRDRVGKLNAALAAPHPLPRRTEQLRRAAGEGELLACNRLGGAILAAVLHEFRLVVIEIEVRWRAGQVDHDHPLRLGGQRRLFRSHRIGRESRRRRAGTQQILHRHRTDAASHAAEQMPTGCQQLVFENRIHESLSRKRCQPPNLGEIEGNIAQFAWIWWLAPFFMGT